MKIFIIKQKRSIKSINTIIIIIPYFWKIIKPLIVDNEKYFLYN